MGLGTFLALLGWVVAALALLTACDAGAGTRARRRRVQPGHLRPAAVTTTTASLLHRLRKARGRRSGSSSKSAIVSPTRRRAIPAWSTVSVVDCAIPHSAEVYLRTDVEVNAAIADVADRECGAGFTQYTGQSVAGSPFVVTYLIDSNQDRTSANPLPSTVICLLQESNGGPLTGSARR